MSDAFDMEKAKADRGQFLRNIPDLFQLHIGGEKPKEGWHILNARPAPYVDIVGNITDLSDFPDQCCDIIYASHIIEHLRFYPEAIPVLKELYRIMKPKGTLMVSVPDLTVLCHMFLDPAFTMNERLHIVGMIYGGQVHSYDYHYFGYDFELMGGLLYGVGFGNIQKVTEFSLFEDTSIFAPYGRPISLNVMATKPEVDRGAP